MLDKKIRDDFPIFSKRSIVYFDNACTTLKPKQVVEAIDRYYTAYSGCAGRSLHKLGKEAEEAFEDSREKIARFINCEKNEVIFTKNTSEAINLVARVLDFSDRNGVVTSILEHHSAFLPFQQLSLSGKITLDIVYPDKEGIFSADVWAQKINKNTKLVVLHHTNNTVATTPPLDEIIKIAHDNGALVLVDGAQGVPHHNVDFKRSNYDFLAFSGHKMLGPTGIGCLIGKYPILENMPPFMVGGETIEEVKVSRTIFAKPPHRFEAGIQHYAGAIGLAAAVEYLKKIGMGNIEKHERELTAELLKTLEQFPEVIPLGPKDANKKTGMLSFNLKGRNPHEIAIMMDEMANICVRSGIFCAQPGMEYIGAPDGALRASLYLYNTKEEIDIFAETLKSIIQITG